jgi:carboxynorspermidine decarboxylase
MLGGPSCLAGDVIGEYNFSDIPKIGDRIALLDQAHYTMVKTSFFNGVKLPSIAIWDSETDNLEIIKSFSFKDFENKL